MPELNPALIATMLLVIFVAITIHEFAHAKFAQIAGDPTPGMFGRVTLNPIKHFDPIGAFFIVFTTIAGFGIGWGRPVPVNPQKMRDPRWDHFWTVAAGPLSNLIQAGVFALFLRGAHLTGAAAFLPELVMAGLLFGVIINLALMFFNLIPLGPLDGGWLFGLLFLRPELRYRYFQWNMTQGTIVLLVILMVGWFTGFSLIGNILQPLVETTASFLLGT